MSTRATETTGANLPREPDGRSLLALAIKLLNDGILSEGQVARASGLDRVKIREHADAAKRD